MITERKQLLVKLTSYYGVLLLILAAIYLFTPQILPYLPIGGNYLQEAIEISPDNSPGEFTSSIGSGDQFIAAFELVLALLGSIIVMLPIRWVYLSAVLEQVNRSIAANLILLPMIVTGIVTIVQNDLALAFSLTGIVAGVSYRTRLKDSVDTLFIFVAIGVGLAAGTHSLGIAIVMAIFFTYTVLITPPIADNDASMKSMENPEKDIGTLSDSNAENAPQRRTVPGDGEEIS